MSIPYHYNLSNWTSSIKFGDIIHFTDLNDTNIRCVKFIEFLGRQCTIKRKFICYENNFTNILFIDKIIVHKILKSQ